MHTFSNTHFHTRFEQFSTTPFSISLLLFSFFEKKFPHETREKTIPTAHRLDPTSIVRPVENNIQSPEQYGGISEGKGSTEFSGLIRPGSLTANTIQKISQAGWGESILPAKTRKLFQ